MFRTPKLLERHELVVAESTRHGGVSEGAYASLNLGKRTDDLPECVEENRRRFSAAVGFCLRRLAWSYQVHGVEVCRVEEPSCFSGYDALVTQQPDVILAVSVADCAPVLLYDMRRRVIAAIHAGWRGTVGGIIPRTLQAMAGWFGTRGSDCLAYIGTCIDKCSFEVGPEVAAQFDCAFVRFDTGKARHFVDLKGALAQQLQKCGVPAEHIEISPYSTVLHSEDYFSHRLSGGRTGRMLAVIGLR